MKAIENPAQDDALSALVDGEADATLAASVTAAWRDDAALRARWHRYQVIGDVLRSDELADCGHDADFLQRLRTRLEQEPVVLAPAPLATAPAAAPRAAGGVLRRWARPAAVAAGFVMVAGVLTVTRVDPVSDGLGSAPTLAQGAAPALAAAPAPRLLVGPLPVAASEGVAPERVELADGVLLRDARLDQYLAAHEQFGAGSALGASGFLHSATHEGPAVVAAPGSR